LFLIERAQEFGAIVMMSDSSARCGNLRIQITIVITAVYVNMTLLTVVFMVHCLDMGHVWLLAVSLGPRV
jgi:hypothetical protein